MDLPQPTIHRLLQTLHNPGPDPAAFARRCAACAEELHEQGEAALPAIRSFLAGPSHGLVIHDGRPIGAKLVALRCLAPAAGDDDAPLLRQLAADPDEPLPVRAEAAAAWLHVVGDTGVPDVVVLLLQGFPLEDNSLGDLLAPLSPWFAKLCRPLIGHLYHRDKVFRLRARSLLVAVGAPAAEGLADIVTTGEDAFARAEAEAALQQIDPSRLHQALADRERSEAVRLSIPREAVRPRRLQTPGRD